MEVVRRAPFRDNFCHRAGVTDQSTRICNRHTEFPAIFDRLGADSIIYVSSRCSVNAH